MDPTLSTAAPAAPQPRLEALHSVRAWRGGRPAWARVLALLAPVAFAAAGFVLTLGAAQARVDIQFDPMRPALPQSISADIVAGAASAATGSPGSNGLPTLRGTRSATPGATAGGDLSALVDDTWVRRGDVVAGYRVTALRIDGIELVQLADPTQRLSLRLNPVSVNRSPSTPAPKESPTWNAPALEKKP
jgi:hypothetical protein